VSPKTRCRRCHKPRKVSRKGYCTSCQHILANEAKAARKTAPQPEQPQTSSIVLDTTLLTLDKVFEIVQAASNAGAVGRVVPVSANEILEKIYDPTSNTSVCRTTHVVEGREN